MKLFYDPYFQDTELITQCTTEEKNIGLGITK